MRPTPDQIRKLRLAAGLTQEAAAQLVHVSDSRAWRRYESGKHEMHGAIWELFNIKVDKMLAVHLPLPSNSNR